MLNASYHAKIDYLNRKQIMNLVGLRQALLPRRPIIPTNHYLNITLSETIDIYICLHLIKNQMEFWLGGLKGGDH
jgi:hypothetical protein